MDHAHEIFIRRFITDGHFRKLALAICEAGIAREHNVDESWYRLNLKHLQSLARLVKARAVGRALVQFSGLNTIAGKDNVRPILEDLTDIMPIPMDGNWLIFDEMIYLRLINHSAFPQSNFRTEILKDWARILISRMIKESSPELGSTEHSSPNLFVAIVLDEQIHIWPGSRQDMDLKEDRKTSCDVFYPILDSFKVGHVTVNTSQLREFLAVLSLKGEAQ